MKGKTSLIAAVMLTTVLSGCATPLNSVQRQELRGYQGKGLVIEEKNPTAAAVLGILPGGGSFYTGNIGPGLANLFFWPISVLWDPVSGYDGAQARNYYATKTAVEKKLKREVSSLDDQLVAGQISKEQYLAKKRDLDAQLSPDL